MGCQFFMNTTLKECDILSDVRIFAINEEAIELYKLLKIENLVASGGEAKYVIAEGLVRVNGEVETRKRKKIVPGDVVMFEGETIRIIAQQKP
jgi:ribosome-associated protein